MTPQLQSRCELNQEAKHSARAKALQDGRSLRVILNRSLTLVRHGRERCTPGHISLAPLQLVRGW